MSKKLNDTAHKILDAAEIFTKTKGFNDFSYKDLQAQVGVKTSSIHYYFPTKQDLGVALIERYTDRFLDALVDLSDNVGTGSGKLQAMGKMFVEVSSAQYVCLCGMLASEILSLPREGVEGLRNFYRETERWVARAIKQGIADGDFNADLDPETAAPCYLAALEGAIMIARSRKDDDYMAMIADEALKNLKR